MGAVLIGLGCCSLAALEIPSLQPPRDECPLCLVSPTSLLHHRTTGQLGLEGNSKTIGFQPPAVGMVANL